MATVTVANGNYGSYLYIEYSFTSNTSARTWQLNASLKLYIPNGYTFGPWTNTNAFSGNLVGRGINSLGGGSHTLDLMTVNGSYNTNGDAPSVNISWAFNVNSPWGGYVNPHNAVTVWGSSIQPAAPTAPSSVVSYAQTTSGNNYSTYGIGETIKIDVTKGSGVITGYDLARKIGSDNWVIISSKDGDTSTVSFTDSVTNSLLAPNTEIRYRVRAKNGSYPGEYKESPYVLKVIGGALVNNNNVWTDGIVWIKQSGSWVRAKRVWAKSDNTWSHK